ncbi:MAG: 5-deoxy-glucuronate isomerase [Clostridia bacterium]|nr:5-deoxy-glucuronate isomerase [Clostridia bacterium]
MNLKKTWDKEYGKSEVITWDNSDLDLIEIDMVRLHGGDSKRYKEEDTEYGIVILGGKCDITGDGFEYKSIGKRKNVFDGAATSVYIPSNREFVITAADGDCTLAVSKCPGEEEFEPVLIKPEDVIIKDLGKPGWERQAHFVLDERVNANYIYIGEAFVDGGQWASYPPHKHDDDNMPTEGVLEEVYYYEFDKPQGFGIQRVYTKEGDVDETYTVKDGDFVHIHRGYHPFCCAPGYTNYYLWVMAGKNRGFFMTTEECHKWLNK